MIRRSMFFGLTLALLLAFVFLSIRGCRQEPEPAGQPMETVEKSKSTATRVLQPQDLEIVHSQMALEKDAGRASHEIEMMNRGNIPYREVGLRLAYLSRSGKVVETRSYAATQTVRPGATLKLTDIRIESLPKSVAGVRISVAYADIGNDPQAAQPHN